MAPSIEISLASKYSSLWTRVFRLYRSYIIALTVLAILYALIQGYTVTVLIAWLVTNAMGLLICFIDAAIVLFRFRYDPIAGNILLVSARYNTLKEIVNLPKNQIRAEAKQDVGTRATRWRLNFYVGDKCIYSQKINHWWNGKKLSEIVQALKEIQR